MGCSYIIIAMATPQYCYLVAESLNRLSNGEKFNWHQVSEVAYCLGATDDSYAGDVYFIQTQIRLLATNPGREGIALLAVRYAKRNRENEFLIYNYFRALESVNNYEELLIQGSEALQEYMGQRYYSDVKRLRGRN